MRTPVTGAALGLALMVAGGVACVNESSAQTSGARVVRDDTASVARLLDAVRGSDPLLCELATRDVDMHGSWSRWGPMGSSPIEGDSASAAMIRWIQREHNDPAVVPRLRAAVRDADGCVRRVAASFLGRVQHPTAHAALIEAAEDARPGTRYVAVVGLGLSENKEAMEILVRRLRDDSPLVRRAAAWALGSLEQPAALTPLLTALERDADPRVRQAAAWAIGQVHP